MNIIANFMPKNLSVNDGSKDIKKAESETTAEGQTFLFTAKTLSDRANAVSAASEAKKANQTDFLNFKNCDDEQPEKYGEEKDIIAAKRNILNKIKKILYQM